MGHMNTNIPGDELHYNDEEKRLVLLRDVEIDKIIIACKQGRHRDIEACIRAVRWAEEARISEIALKGILSGRLGINAFEDECRMFEIENEVNNEFRDDD